MIAPNRSSNLILAAIAAIVVIDSTTTPHAHAAPAPEVEYVYNVTVRRQLNFPNKDAVGYGHAICDKVRAGESYGPLMADVQADITPTDPASSNFLISYAVNLLCPDLVWQLRQSAAGYRLPADAGAPETYF